MTFIRRITFEGEFKDEGVGFHKLRAIEILGDTIDHLFGCSLGALGPIRMTIERLKVEEEEQEL